MDKKNSVEEKQNYLRENIIEKGYDPNEFVEFAESKKGENAKVNLAIKLPDKFGYYEGYFRMFTPSGLPFGDIIKIKVFNRN